MPLIALLLACSAAPPVEAPPPPPPVPLGDAEACRLGDAEACRRQRDAAEAARRGGRWADAAALFASVCAARPDDVACVLADRVGALGSDPRAACAATRHPPSCAAAEPALAEACDRGDGAACRVRAAARLAGAVPGTSTDAARLLWAGCAADDGWSCLALAELADRGEPLPEGTRGDAAWLRAQACDLQIAYACAPHRW